MGWVRTLEPEDWLAILVTVAFVVFSLPRLNLPLFWDSTWVYGPAIHDLWKAGPSLLPDSLPVGTGRGHPLMFHFLGALWCRLFGFSAIALNAYALTISILVLVMVYRIGAVVWVRSVGLIALMICATQEIFLTQAMQLLPEMLLSLFVLTTFYTWLKNQYLLFVLSGTVLLLTKETGIVVIGALAIVLLIRMFYTRSYDGSGLTGFIKGAALLAAPVLVASSHYIYQKLVFGWYFFPEHVEMQIWDPVPILYRLRDVFDLIFVWQGRKVITILTLISIAILIGRRKIVAGAIVGVTLVAMYFVFHDGSGIDVRIRLGVPLVAFIVLVLAVLLPSVRRHVLRGIAINTLVIYLALFMAFTSINLLTARYVLNGLPIYALIIGVVLSHFITRKWMYLPLFLTFFGVFLFQLTLPRDIRDINLTYADGVKMYQEITRYFDTEIEKPCSVMGTLLEAKAMTDPRACYVSEPVEDVHVIIQRDTMKLIDGKVDYMINSNVLEYISLPTSSPDCCTLIHVIKIGQAKAEVYKITPR